MEKAKEFPADRYLSFYGGITPPASDVFRHQLNDIVNEGSTSVTILFASGGGRTDDGIALSTYIQALPLRITMHAIGLVASIAIPVFLSVKKEQRLASVNARFMFHQYTWDFGAGDIPDSMVREAALMLEDGRKWQREILRTKTDLVEHGYDLDKIFAETTLMDAVTAVKVGLAGAKGEPCIARGSMSKIASA